MEGSLDAQDLIMYLIGGWVALFGGGIGLAKYLIARSDRQHDALLKRIDELYAKTERDKAEFHARMDRDKADSDGRMDRDKTELHARMDRDKADLDMRVDRVEGRVLAQFSEVRGQLRQLTRKTSVLEGAILGRAALRDEPVGVAAQQVPEETDPTEPQD